MLVKTTRLLPAVFDLLKFTLDNVTSYRQDDLRVGAKMPIRNKGLLTIFVDKIVKILHISLLHPREYSVDIIAKFLTEVPHDDPNATRNWLYVLKLFRLVGS